MIKYTLSPIFILFGTLKTHIVKVTKVDIDALNAILKLEVDKEDFEPQILNSLKLKRKRTDLKGFRKGQVPMGQIKKMFGNDILMETINTKLADVVNVFIRKHNIDVLGHPLPKEGQTFNMDINAMADFTFEYEIGIAPEFKSEFLNSKPTFEREVPEVDNKILDEEVLRMQKQLGVAESVDSIKEDTDMLVVVFDELDEKGAVLEGGVSNESSISLELIENAKVAKATKKLKSTEFVDIDMFNTFSQDDEAVAKHLLAIEKTEESNSSYRMTLKEIKRITPAEINEEFLKKVYGQETGLTDEKGLRDKIKGDLTAYFSKQADNKMFNEIHKKIIAETKVDLPEAFLKRWIRTTNENPISEEQVANEYPAFRNNLIWSLVVKNIKAEAKMEVTADEIKAKTAEGIKAQMMQYGMNDFAGPEMETFVASMMARQDHVSQTKDAILEEKVFAYIKTKIIAKDKSVSLEEFNKQA
ncbi:MAG: trigger factor [Planctomycetota bacterium]